MSIEADIRSEEKKKRRITFTVNGERVNAVIIGVPESIRFGVCLLSLSFYLIYPFVKHRLIYITRIARLNSFDLKECQKRMR